MSIEYKVALDDLQGHYLKVEIRFNAAAGDIDLAMPAWTPGSYFLRHYARNVSRVKVSDGHGTQLRARKIDRQTWRVHSAGAGELIVSYRVYAFDESVRGAYLSDEECFFTPAAVAMRIVGREGEAATIAIKAPPTMKRINTGLDCVADEAWVFRASNYDHLIDSPFMIGNQRVETFENGGKTHHVAIAGRGNFAIEQLVADLDKIVYAATSMFWKAPYDRYTFMIRLTEADWGGLEHASSNISVVPANSFRPKKTYRDRVLALLAHEYFHLWNVKRLRPVELGPFNYDREVHTTMLWLAEGVTSYFESLLLRRAKLITADEYMDRLAGDQNELTRVPGRFEDSLEESSWDAWIKHYIRDEHSMNRSVSYYTKGAVAMFALDLDIRARTSGESGLENVLLAVYQRFHEGANRGVTTDEFRAVCEEFARGSLAKHFDEHLRLPGDIDLEPYLNPAGIIVKRVEDIDGVPTGEKSGAYIGAVLEQTADRGVRVARVPAGSPAMKGGLYARDEVIAIDGWRIRKVEEFAARLLELNPEQEVELLVARRGEMRSLTVKLDKVPMTRFKFERTPTPTLLQKTIYSRVFGDDWPSSQRAASS